LRKRCKGQTRKKLKEKNHNIWGGGRGSDRTNLNATSGIILVKKLTLCWSEEREEKGNHNVIIEERAVRDGEGIEHLRLLHLVFTFGERHMVWRVLSGGGERNREVAKKPKAEMKRRRHRKDPIEPVMTSRPRSPGGPRITRKARLRLTKRTKVDMVRE